MIFTSRNIEENGMLDLEKLSSFTYDQVEDKNTMYKVFKDSYEKAVGSSWEQRKFEGRAKGWLFFGDQNGYIAVRPQRCGLYKLTGIAGNVKSILKGFDELMEKTRSENIPVWGMVTREIADMAERKGLKVIHGYKYGLLLKAILPFIPKGVFGGVDFDVNMKGEVTLKYHDVGDITKIFICNDNYISWLKSNIIGIPQHIRKIVESII